MLTDEFCDIYGLQYKPFWHKSGFGFLCIFVVICVVSLLILLRYYFYRKIPQASIYEQALVVLKSKKIIALIDENRSENFYTMLMMTIRSCVSDYVGQSLIGKTDSEMSDFFMHVDFSAHWLVLFKEIIAGATLARFANQGVAQEQMKSDLQRALTMVTEMMVVKQQQLLMPIIKK